MNFSQLHTHLPKRSLLIAAAVLISLSFFTSWFFQSKPSVEQQQKLLQSYIQKQQKDAKQLLADTGLLRRLVLHKESFEEFTKVEEKKYGVFLFAETISENQDLLFWNTQKMIPPEADFSLPDGIYFKLLDNGYYVLQKTKIQLPGMSNNIIGYILIPVLHKYFLETTRSQTQFAHSGDAIKKISLSEVATEFPIKSFDGKTLFHVTKPIYADNEYAEPVTLALRFFAILLLLIYLHLFIETISKKKGAVVAVLLLAIALLALRFVFYYFPELFSLRKLTLFDPAIYASSSINRSLGDLLISALFLCWTILYAWTTLGPIKKLPAFLKGGGILIAGVAGIFLLIFVTFQLANIVYDLVTNSKISFDVTNFFGLDVYTAFWVFCISAAFTYLLLFIKIIVPVYFIGVP